MTNRARSDPPDADPKRFVSARERGRVLDPYEKARRFYIAKISAAGGAEAAGAAR